MKNILSFIFLFALLASSGREEELVRSSLPILCSLPLHLKRMRVVLILKKLTYYAGQKVIK
jgi:hypothetical protein